MTKTDIGFEAGVENYKHIYIIDMLVKENDFFSLKMRD